MIMDKNTVYKLSKFISNTRYPIDQVKKSWPDFLRMIGVKHTEAVKGIQDLLENPGEDLGLNYDELIRLALVFNSRHLKRLVYDRKIPPSVQEKHPELLEDEDLDEAGGGAAPAAGTSFTSTQNTAPYAVPLGTLRRDWWKKKKREK